MRSATLSDAVESNGVATEFEGGVFLDDLPEGAVLEVETQHHRYTIVNQVGGQALISGHPKFCPDPIPVRIDGSGWGGSMLKLGFIGLGMHLAFQHPTYRTITTSSIVRIRTTGESSKS